MLALLAVFCFFAAVLVHGGVFTVHNSWLDWQGLMLAGLLLWAASGVSVPVSWQVWRRKGD